MIDSSPEQGRHAHERTRRPRRRTPASRVVLLAVAATLVLSLVTLLSVSGGGQPEPRPARTPAAAAPSHTSTPRSATSGDGGSAAGSTATAHRSPHKVTALADHPLLQDSVGLRPGGCELPEWGSSPAAMKAFFRAARQCLDAAWAPVLRRYGLPFHPPELHFPTGTSFRTECGTIQIGVATAAYYCEGDLYVPYEGLQTEQYGRSPGIYLALFAHEYGHHVQELAGIMDAAWHKIYRAGRNSPEGLEMARRKELQAQCFSGMFLGTHVGHGGDITQRMFEAAWADQAARGDDGTGARTHGSNAHYAYWWRTGARTNSLAACNTFTAPSSAVS